MKNIIYKININTKILVKIIILTILSFTFINNLFAIDFKSNVKNLGKQFNTKKAEFCPTVTKDGKIMLYNSKSKTGNDDDIFISKYSNGKWSNPTPFNILNSKDNDESPYITPDGKMIVFASDRVGSKKPSITANDKDRITYDIYISYNIGGEWTSPKNIEGTVNTIFNERSPSLSLDKKTLYFTRWPYKRLKKAKIYKSQLSGTNYINVQPLPFPINANQYDLTIIPAQKQNGFYFSSRRAGGYGGWDIYYVNYFKGKFGNPINLGSNVNSSADELTFTDSGYKAYLSSNRLGSYGKFDIFSIKIPNIKRKPFYVKKEIKKKVKIKITPKPKQIIKQKIIVKTPKTRLRFLVTSNKKEVVAEFKINLKTEIINRKKLSTIKTIRKTIRRSNKNGFFYIIPKKDIQIIEVICNDKRYKIFRKDFIVEKNITSTYQIILSKYHKEIKKAKSKYNKIRKIQSKKYKTKKKNSTSIKLKSKKKIIPIIKITKNKDKKKSNTKKKIVEKKNNPKTNTPIIILKPKKFQKKYKFKIITLYFTRGASKIEMNHLPDLHTIINRLRKQHDLKITISSFSNKKYNQKRLESIKQYLVNHGVNINKIKKVKKHNKNKNKVEIKYTKK